MDRLHILIDISVGVNKAQCHGNHIKSTLNRKAMNITLGVTFLCCNVDVCFSIPWLVSNNLKQSGESGDVIDHDEAHV